MRHRKKPAARLSAEDLRAVANFSDAVQKTAGRASTLSEKVGELVGRWEALSDGAPGLLGSNLLTLVNEQVLDEQLGRLSESVSKARGAPEELAEQADFVGGLLGEYAALLKVLAGIELEPSAPLARDWEELSDQILECGSELQARAEDLELALEGEDEPQARSVPAAGLRTASREFLRQVWEKAQAGEKLQGEEGRLADAMRLHPEYRVAWESPPEGGREYTIRGVNPYVHVSMHVAVESQLAQGEPPEIAAALDRLTAAGVDRHEAVHRIANLLIEQLWHIEREGGRFNRAAYVQALNQLRP